MATTVTRKGRIAGALRVRSSPEKHSTTETSPPINGSQDPKHSSPRKAHHCKHCQRSKQGHPRSGCPYVDPPIPPTSSQDAVDELVLSRALDALQVNSSTEMQKCKSRRSPSHDTHTKDHTGGTVLPSAVQRSNATCERGEDVLTLPTPTDKSRHVRTATPAGERSPRHARAGIAASSLSHQETEVFFDRITDTAKGHATVFKYVPEDIPDLVASAKARGFMVQVVEPEAASAGEETCWVIIGKDEQLIREIGELGAKDKDAMNAAMLTQVHRGYHPAVVAAGVAVGAVATWTGLAFS